MHKISRFTLTMLGVVGVSLLAGQGNAQPTYEEDMARQRAQEQQNMEYARASAEWEEANLANNESGDDKDDWSGSSFYSAPPQYSYNWIAASAELNRKEHEERMANDPVYRDLSKGIWTFHQPEPSAPRQACIATFWTLKGGVTMIHWGGKDNITMLGFFGSIIPKPEKPEVVALDLTQSGEKQSVRAINTRFGPGGNLGMFVFLVPSAQALLNSIEDNQDFQVDYKGVTTAQGNWHSGLKARAELAKCVASQPTLSS